MIIEPNHIYDVDCIEGMKNVGDKSIDLIFCDLPYGQTHNRWDNIIAFEPMWEQFERIIKDSGAIVLFAQGGFAARLIMSNEKLFRYDIVWEKTTPTGFHNANLMPLRNHEQLLVFYKHLPTYNPQKTYGHERKVSTAHHKRNSTMSSNYGKYELTTYDSTERFPTSVWKFATDKQKSAIHPTQKPVDLCRYVIRTYTNPNDLVLDCTCGSGTIPLAAYIENRQYIGMDNGVSESGKPWAVITDERIKHYKYSYE